MALVCRIAWVDINFYIYKNKNMDEKLFKQRVARLKEVSKVIEDLPAEIRTLSFPLLEGYISGSDPEPGKKSETPSKAKSKGAANDDDHAGRDEFLAKNSHDKPADNVYLLAAALFRDYGSEPFSIKELETLATDTGVTVPNRIDMTLKQGTNNGKNLFTSSSRGFYKPTVHGEAFLKETYKISKGTKKKTPAE